MRTRKHGEAKWPVTCWARPQIHVSAAGRLAGCSLRLPLLSVHSTPFRTRHGAALLHMSRDSKWIVLVCSAAKCSAEQWRQAEHQPSSWFCFCFVFYNLQNFRQVLDFPEPLLDMMMYRLMYLRFMLRSKWNTLHCSTYIAPHRGYRQTYNLNSPAESGEWKV